MQRGGSLAYCGVSTSLRSCVLWGNASHEGMQIAIGAQGIFCSAPVLDVA